MSDLQRINNELEELRNIYSTLDELNQKKLEQAIIMLITKFSQRIK